MPVLNLLLTHCRLTHGRKFRLPTYYMMPLLGLLFSMATYANQGPESNPVDTQGGASKPAGAVKNTATLEEVIVTARRRQESLQSVPIAITAFGQDKLKESNIQSVTDLQHYVPSLTMNGPFRNTPLVSIRGQGGFTPGGIPSVIIYVNEVPAPTSAQAGSPGGALGGNGLFYDLENIQVLKGPQGTLFGRNTTGGALLLQSKRPTNQFGGHVEVAAGNYSNREFDAALNLPAIPDKLLFRLALNGQDREGFTEVQDSPGRRGKDLDDANHVSARLTTTFIISDTLENDLIVDFIDSDTNGTSSILVGVNDNPMHPVNQFFPGVNNALAQQQALGIRDQVPIGVDMHSDMKRWSVTDILTWDINSNLTLRNIFSYVKAEYSQTIDGDGTAFPIFDPIADVDKPYITRQYSEELQLQGLSLEDKLNWTLGVFYLDSPVENDFTLHTTRIFGGTSFRGFRQGERSRAIYFQGTHDLSSRVEGLSVTAGVRYTWDDITRQARLVRANGNCLSPFSDPGCVDQGYGHFHAPTWTLSLDYQINPETLIYLASRRGYRSGGFNLAGDTQRADKTFDSEHVTDLELGMKADWFFGEMSARTDIALYIQEYSDIQLSQVSTATSGGPLTVVRNAAEARISGLELQSNINLTERLQINARFSWLDFEYKNVDPGVTQPIIVTNAPDYKYGLGVSYMLPAPSSIGSISVGADWNWQDDISLVPAEDPFGIQEDYSLLTLNAKWEGIFGNPFDLSLFMTNATDEEYAIGGLPLTSTLGTSTLAYGAPRMWGLRVNYNFGDD